jgi:hypothetical protein
MRSAATKFQGYSARKMSIGDGIVDLHFSHQGGMPSASQLRRVMGGALFFKLQLSTMY